MLAHNQATIANNVKLYAGELRYWRGPTVEYTPTGIPVSIYKMYRGSSSAWLTFTADTDVVLGPLADTNEIRLYYTSTAFSLPRKTNWSLATGGSAPFPASYLNMGVPSPVTALTVATSTPITGATVVSGGTGYSVGNTLTVQGGTGTAATLTVSAVSSGVITAVTVASGGSYSVLPTNPVSVTSSPGSGATFTLTYPAVTTSVYVYTYLSTFGSITEESGPSPATSPLSTYFGNAVNLSGFATAPLAAAGYNITGLRIYRSVYDSSGNVNYAFVDQLTVSPATGVIPASGTSTNGVSYTSSTYPDSRTATQLGVALPSLTWSPPPAGLTGIVAMANGILAGFVGNTIYFSEPYYPHAWPLNYALTVPDNIVGLGAFGSTLVVGTDKFPYVISGTTPSGMSQERLPLAEPCVSKRSIASDQFGVSYASPNGLVGIGQGERGVTTYKLFRRDEWQTLNPSSLIGAIYDNKYIGVFTSGLYQPNTQALVLSRDDVPGLSLLNDVTKLQITAMHVDQRNGYLYFVNSTDNIIYRADADELNPTTYDWQSKRFALPKGETWTCIKVDADYNATANSAAYNAKIAAIAAYNQGIFSYTQYATFTPVNTQALNAWTLNGGLPKDYPMPQTQRAIQAVIYGDDGAVVGSLSFTSYDPLRLPPFRAREIQVRLTGNASVRGFALASTVLELHQ
jgi:hypothetical protein